MPDIAGPSNTADPAGFITVARVGDIPPGQGATFTVGERLVAVFHVDGNYQAIDDLCPHMGASLGAGMLEDGVVTCPWHAWRWDVTTGANINNPAVKVACYTITEQDGNLFVDVGG